jgi:putative FmdB family regulatory protein
LRISLREARNMPVYEFYCNNCHTIFNFLSRRVNTEKHPDCPRCGRPELERQVSLFAVSKGRPESEEPTPGMPNMDEEKLERAMMSLAGEMEGVDENDPRAMARFMRKLSEATGMNLGPMEEAIRRLESGADPEQLEEEMGDLFDDDNMETLFSKEGIKGLKRKYVPPAHDDTLYVL